jgi:hypothetical protein
VNDSLGVSTGAELLLLVRKDRRVGKRRRGPVRLGPYPTERAARRAPLPWLRPLIANKGEWHLRRLENEKETAPRLALRRKRILE